MKFLIDYEPLLLTPGPVNISSRVKLALTRHFSHRSKQFHEVYKNVVNMLKEVFRTNGDVYLITASGTGAVETAILNLITPNDKVVVLTFGTFSRRFRNQIERVNKNIISIEFPINRCPKFEDFKTKFEELNIKDVDIFVTVYNETNPGTTLRDLPKIIDYVKSHGAITIIDNISGLCGDYFDTDGWKVDVVISASQKCLCAPPGISFIAISSNETWRKIEKVNCISTYFDVKLFKKFSERFETPFTPAVNVIAALYESLNMILYEFGLENWINWHIERARVIYNSLKLIGLKPFIEDDYIRSNTVISFIYPNGIDPKEFRIELYNKYGIDVADGMDEVKGKIFRIGNMGWLTRKDIITLITSIISVLINRGVRLNIDKIDEVFKEVHNYKDLVLDQL